MPIKKLTTAQRTRALDHLAQGHSIEETARILQKEHHPEETVEHVRAKYFPRCGAYAISYLEGASPEEIKRKREIIARHADRSSKLMDSLHQDPDFAAARDERARARFTELNQDPDFAAARDKQAAAIFRALHQDSEFAATNRERASKHMTELNQDPDFAAARDERGRKRFIKHNKDPAFIAANKVRMKERRKDPEFEENRLRGLARYHTSRRARVLRNCTPEGTTTAEEWQIVPVRSGRKVIKVKMKVPIPAIDHSPSTMALKKEQVALLSGAIDNLTPSQQEIVRLHFGMDGNPQSIEEAAEMTGRTPKQARRLLQRALNALAQNEELLALK